jgi:hypothetical protein
MPTPSPKEPITGKVARILSSRELIINRGVADGVRLGMRFAVLDPKGENVTDPDTGRVLGSIFRPKVRVRVVSVQEHLSVAQTFETSTTNVGGRGGLGFSQDLADIFAPPKYVEKVKTLRTDETTWETLDESQSFVKTGDPVQELVDEGQGILAEPGSASSTGAEGDQD